MTTKHAHNTGISSLRLQLGMTQQEFADSLGVSRSLVGMAEIGVRSLPQAAQPLLMGLHELSKQLAPAATGYTRVVRKGRVAPAKIYNRVDSQARRRNITGRDGLKTAGVAAPDNQSSMTVDSNGTITIKAIPSTTDPLPDREGYTQMVQVYTVQKQVLEQQLQYRMQERESAAVKGQELEALLNYTASMIDIEDEHISSLAVPLSKKNAEIRKAKFQHKKLLLERQLMRFNSPSLLLRELKISTAQRQIGELVALLGTLEQQLNALPGL